MPAHFLVNASSQKLSAIPHSFMSVGRRFHFFTGVIGHLTQRAPNARLFRVSRKLRDCCRAPLTTRLAITRPEAQAFLFILLMMQQLASFDAHRRAPELFPQRHAIYYMGQSPSRRLMP